MWISFAWTTPALLAGAKTCTRRTWSGKYAKAFHAGQLVDAYDRQPCYGGKKVATIRLTADPYLESTGLMTEQDYIDEGFQWMEDQGTVMRKLPPRQFFDNWRDSNELVYVVRFKLLRIIEQEVASG